MGAYFTGGASLAKGGFKIPSTYGFARGGIPPLRKRIVVGEDGEEKMIDLQTGNVETVGQDGQEVKILREPKLVLPNPATLLNDAGALPPLPLQRTAPPEQVSPPLSRPADLSGINFQSAMSGRAPMSETMPSGQPAMTATMGAPLVRQLALQAPDSGRDTLQLPSPLSRNLPNLDEQSQLASEGPSTAEPLARRDSDRIIRKSVGPRDGTGGMTAAAFSAGPPAPALALSSSPAPSRLTRLVQQIDDLESAPLRDKNGRFKSALKTDGLGALRDLASGGLPGAIGGAAFGGVYGAINKTADEQLGRQSQLGKLNRRFDAATKRAMEIARIGDLNAQADARRNDGRTPHEPEQQRMALANHIGKFYPQGYDGSDPNINAELQRLQMQPPPKVPKGSPPVRPIPMYPGQVLATQDRDGKFVYTKPVDENGKPLPDQTVTQQQGHDVDLKNLGIKLDEHNLYRQRLGQRPVTFSEWLNSGMPGGAPTKQTAPTPSGPKGAELVPSGQPSSNVPRIKEFEPYSGGGRGGSGGESKSEQINSNVSLSLLRDVEQLRSQARFAAEHGRVDEKRSILQSMHTLIEAAKHNPNLKGRFSYGGEPDSDGDVWPSVTPSGASAAPSPARRRLPAPPQSVANMMQPPTQSQNAMPLAGRTVTRKGLEDFARDNKTSVRAAAEHFRSLGATIQ